MINQINKFSSFFYVKVKVQLDNLINDQRGVTAIEYAIVGVAISAIVAYVMGDQGPLSTALMDAMQRIADNINNVDNATGGGA